MDIGTANIQLKSSKKYTVMYRLKDPEPCILLPAILFPVSHDASSRAVHSDPTSPISDRNRVKFQAMAKV